MSEWKECRLGEIASFTTGKLNSNAAVSDGRYPFFTCAPTPLYINNAAFNQEAVILAGNNAEGNFAINYYNGEFNAYQRTYVLTARNNINTKFLYYSLSQFLKDFKALSRGTATKFLTASILNTFKLSIPQIAEQKKIAAILSSLDQKIETNRKINARLEELAQAIFKSWFIDFEPFGGKMPADWELKSLSGIANYLNGLAMQKYSPINNHDKLPVLKIKELGEGRINDNSDFCSKANIGSDHIIENGDIIFSWSGTLLVKIWTGGKCGLNQHLFKVTSNQYPKWFYYFWTLHHNAEFKRIAKDKAVTMGHIKREELDKALVSVPPLDIMHRISGIMDPIFNQLISTNLESARLSALRDTLLPKLMSGELIPE